MVDQIIGSFLLFAFSSLFTRSMVAPGDDVPRQLTVILIWYFAGALTVMLWR